MTSVPHRSAGISEADSAERSSRVSTKPAKPTTEAAGFVAGVRGLTVELPALSAAPAALRASRRTLA